jgi:anaerobic magnesium-protoporphyrin IX monomethyl ester cyclase
MERHARILVIDLNSFARFPTLAVGSLVGALRRAGHDVQVICPFRHGAPTIQREGQETYWQYFQKRVYFSTHPIVGPFHNQLLKYRNWWVLRPSNTTQSVSCEAMDAFGPNVILVSAYVDFYRSVVRLAAAAKERKIPFVLGGPVFNHAPVARAWRHIDGLTAIVGGEVERSIGKIVADLLEGQSPAPHPGLFLPDGREGPPAAPLDRLDQLAPPDFSDFPWEAYPVRIIPALATRGCGWGRCTFCADIFTANGRTVRMRPAESVFAELRHQSDLYDTRDVLFVDMKLNSNVPLWRDLIDGYQAHLPGGQWIGVVHVGQEKDNGLSAADMEKARRAGMVRISFGLETASDRLNKMMSKGTSITRISEFVRNAHGAGISIRSTAMVGYPGETSADVDLTTKFLEKHYNYFDRVKLSLFKALPGTRFEELHRTAPDRVPGVKNLKWNYRYYRGEYYNANGRNVGYRQAKARLLRLVYDINRKPLRTGAEMFDGLM